MYKSLLMLGAFLCSFAQISHAQCTANILPTILEICEGESATFNATTGGNLYQWYLDGNPVGTNSDELVLTGQPPGVYQVSVDVTFGTCVASVNFSSLVVNAIPVATASNSSCQTPTIYLYATGTYPPGTTFMWTGPGAWMSTQQNPVIMNAQPYMYAQYNLVVTYNGCQSLPATTNANGFGAPVTGSSSGPACIGGTIQLTASSPGTGTYTWTGPGNFYSNQQNPVIVVDNTTEGGVYQVEFQEMGFMCGTFDTALVTTCNTVSLTLYNDLNNDCNYVNNDDASPYSGSIVEIDSNGVTVETISATNGFYYTPHGKNGDVYDFKLISTPGDLTASCPLNGIISHTVQSTGLTHLFMGMNCANPGAFDLAVYPTNPGSTAIAQQGYIYVSNDNCSSTPATVTMTHSPKYQYLSAMPAPTSVNGNMVTWSFNNLSNNTMFPLSIHYELEYAVNPLVSGDTTHSLFTIEPTTGDANTADNSFFIIDTVMASLDPNAITAFPQECVAAGTNMQYLIQFENTGNAVAENIYVLDTLPAELDINSMKMVMSSHHMYVTKIQSGGYNILRFDFHNINLADSSDHIGRHGQLIYTIDLDGALPYGANIDHQAGIYFDYNAVVMTNNERSSICVPQNVSSTTIGGSTILYPNPAGDELTVQTDGSFTNATITNSIGQVLMEQQLDKKQQRINISSLAPGMYYVNISGAQGNEVVKFVKM